MAVFENWSLISVDASPDRVERVALRGEIVGHGHVPDGTIITTGPLVHFDLETRLARTANATYRLGSIDLAFAPSFGDASGAARDTRAVHAR